MHCLYMGQTNTWVNKLGDGYDCPEGKIMRTLDDEAIYFCCNDLETEFESAYLEITWVYISLLIF